MSITHDPIDTLAAHRPLTADWSPDDREATVERLLAAAAAPTASRMPVARPSRRDAAPRPVRRRFVLAGVAAAAAGTLVIGLPLASDWTAPKASAVEQLVASAQRSHALVIPQGWYLHMVVHARQHMPSADDPMDGVPWVEESWTGADGRVWRHDTQGTHMDNYAFPALTGGPIDYTPKGVAKLPTSPSDLMAYLRARVQGSNSTDEAIFVAVGDMTRMGYVPPAVRAALISVAGALPEVTATRSGGRTTLAFVDESTRPGSQSLVFDSGSAALVGEAGTSPGADNVATIEILGLVDHVPADVLTEAAAQAKRDAAIKG